MLVRALYQWQIASTSERDLIAQFRGEQDFEKIDERHFRLLLNAVLSDPDKLDAVISEFAARGVEHLDAVGRAVLLAALAEFEHCENVPSNVVINEAVELAKRYGAADSFRFVNAVLDKAARRYRERKH